MSTELPPPLLIDAPGRVPLLRQALAGAQRIALDTESNSLFAFREQVCLIQLSTAEGDLLIDTLALGAADLAPLAEALADPGIEKVLHGAEYDVLCLKRDFDFALHHLFDTALAARVLGWERFSLSNLLEEQYGLKLEKRYQRADWGERPLPPEMLRYAQLDTHYLFDLRERMAALLSEAGRMEEAQVLFDDLEHLPRPPLPSWDADGFWRLNGARSLSPRQVAVLAELYRFRLGEAQRRNVPPFKVMNDAALVALADQSPRTMGHLGQVPGLSPGLIRRYGAALLAAISAGRAAPPPVRPVQPPPPPEAVLARIDALLEWRKHAAAARGVSAEIIFPKDVLAQIARSVPKTLEELGQVERVNAWRLAAYGEAILKAVAEAPPTRAQRKAS